MLGGKHRVLGCLHTLDDDGHFRDRSQPRYVIPIEAAINEVGHCTADTATMDIILRCGPCRDSRHEALILKFHTFIVLAFTRVGLIDGQEDSNTTILFSILQYRLGSGAVLVYVELQEEWVTFLNSRDLSKGVRGIGGDL